MKEIYDYSKLKGSIKEKFGTQSRFATAMGLSNQSISGKLNNNVDFSQEEIGKAIKLLDIPASKISQYFFSSAV